MPPDFTYPGVYIEETSHRQTIVAADTTRTLFLGHFNSGPFNTPHQIIAAAELSNAYGADAATTLAGQSVRLFFENGGRSATVIRIEGDDVAAALAAVAKSCSLVVVPRTAAMPPKHSIRPITEVQNWAGKNKAFYLLDPPPLTTAAELAAWLGQNPGLRTNNTASYWPQAKVPGGAVLPLAAAVAGVIARTDAQQGVWKAPAGVLAAVHGLTELSQSVTDADVELLNNVGVNTVLDRGQGPVVWGGRTVSSDPQWRYVSVRRLALHLERSIEHGIRWAVFEPNNANLWAAVESTVADFLGRLWRAGALLGDKPESAYFVRIGRDTMTQNDIDAGRLILHVGFAPIRPAEFVILRFEQKEPSRTGPPLPSRLVRLAADVGPQARLLFTGAAGTSKTQAARWLANQLQQPLVRIDSNKLVSKYIGETEKNLSQVFAEATRRNGILFFDEADALFAKRPAEAQDRYANLEVSYLLERVETFPGIAILATNRRYNIDYPFIEFDE